VHPQSWPEDLDHTGKRVIVIGSGATAAALVPAMAETGLDEHQVRRWTPWRRWTVIAMLAYALLAVLAAPNRHSIPLPPG
jgi:cation diffusion facilitator CzcD-associated flavoprotein CzcO